MRTVRLAACYATCAACVPYLTLKVAWLSGSTVGWNDPALADNSALVVGNAITFGMDLVAVLVALAFTYSWGRRLPGPLVLGPMWIGTGLLAPIVLGVPLGEALQVAVGGGSPAGAETGLQGWVYTMVYGGFTVQGIALLTAFVFYVRDRWPSPPRTARRPLAYAAMLPLAAFAIYRATDSGTVAQHTVGVVSALLALAAPAGLLALRRYPALAIAAVWTGSSATFAWASYMLLVGLAHPFHDTALSPAAKLLLLCGTLGGALTALAWWPGERGPVLLGPLSKRTSPHA